jgi:hypothetical protein
MSVKSFTTVVVVLSKAVLIGLTFSLAACSSEQMASFQQAMAAFHESTEKYREPSSYGNGGTSDAANGAASSRTSSLSGRLSVQNIRMLMGSGHLYVVGKDGTFLGDVSNPYAAKSLANRYGNHGSPYASDSMWNKYGDWGGSYSATSAQNAYASYPPTLVLDGNPVAVVTVNEYTSPSVHPETLRLAVK